MAPQPSPDEREQIWQLWQQIRPFAEAIHGGFVAIAGAFTPVVQLAANQFREIAIALQTIGPEVAFRLGKHAATTSEPRDWSKSDAWHRGYLAGLLALAKARKRGEPIRLA
jgi:hypothetical protein